MQCGNMKIFTNSLGPLLASISGALDLSTLSLCCDVTGDSDSAPHIPHDFHPLFVRDPDIFLWTYSP